MKRILISALVACLMLGACGKSEETVSNNDNNQSPEDSISGLKNQYKIGDIVTLGEYEQDGEDSNGKEAVEWIVIGEDGSRALLLSKYVLFSEQYNNQGGKSSWETCSLNKFLNSEFIDEAFSEDEKKHIADVAGVGKVFCLSYEEAITYFEMSSFVDEDFASGKEYERYFAQLALGEPTEVISKKFTNDKPMTQEKLDDLKEDGIDYDTNVIGKKYVDYWLRTIAGGIEDCAHIIEDDGTLADRAGTNNMVDKRQVGVRPAIWVEE